MKNLWVFSKNFQILPTLTFRCGFLDLRTLWTWFNFCYIPQAPHKLLDTFKTSRGSMKNFLDALKVSQSRERRNTQNWSKFVDSKFQVNFQILPILTTTFLKIAEPRKKWCYRICFSCFGDEICWSNVGNYPYFTFVKLSEQ